MISIRRIQSGESALYRSVRLAALKDAPYAFCATYEAALGRSDESWKTQADEAAAGDSQAIFIAFDDSEPVGISAIYKSEEDELVAEIFQVWVSPRCRGLGVGHNILDTLIAWAKSVGCRRILATVTQTNPEALGFYANYGFAKHSETNGETKMIQRTL